jgi:hypothetical protein
MLQRLIRPTMVLAMNDNHQSAVPIEAGKIVDVVGSAEDDRFVIVSVEGEQFLAFASDLADRPTPVATF